MTKKDNYIYAVGRRKEATARVRLKAIKGDILVNDKPVGEYFLGEVAKTNYQKPFDVTDTLGKFSATVKVAGSGKNAQLTAVMHGLARALDKYDHDNYHTLLKKADLLTRDPRTREQRKVGKGGKARRAKQSPKR